MAQQVVGQSFESQARIIELLARHEETLAELYTMCGRRFPRHRDFWLQLAGEESTHAGWIRALYPHIQTGAVSMRRDRFKVAVLSASLNYVNQQVAAAQTVRISLTNALSIALDLENALLDSQFFQVLDGDSRKLRRVLRGLAGATDKHRTILETAGRMLTLSPAVRASAVFQLLKADAACLTGF